MAKVYNPHEVVVMIGDSLIDAGYADGEFLRIEMVSEETTSSAGTDGEVAVSVNKDRRATVTLLLMQTGDGNRRIQEKVNLVRALGGSPSLGSFYVRDLNGQSLYEAPSIWLKKRPDVSLDRTATTREWAFEVDNLDSFEGGNDQA